MTRLKSTAFAGVRIYDADPDAPTFRRVIESVVSDAALIYDKLTGLNAEASTIDHSGGLRGCPLGVPWVNQAVDANLSYDGGVTATPKNGDLGETYLLAVPIFCPSVEASEWHRVEVDIDGATHVGVSFDAVVMTSAGAMTEYPMEKYDVTDDAMFITSVKFVAGLQYLLIRVDTSRLINTQSLGGTLVGWRVSPMRERVSAQPMLPQTIDDSYGVTAPAAGSALAWRDFDSVFVADGAPLHAYLTTGVNRNLNGLYEYLTGMPAGRDATYTQIDEDGAGAPDDIDPARPRFHGGMRGGTYPGPEWPLVACALGATRSDGYSVVDVFNAAAQMGMVDWQAPQLVRTAASQVARVPAAFPDFPSATLQWCVLASSNADVANGANYTATINVYTTAGVLAGTGTSTFTRIGTTNLLYATNFGVGAPSDASGYIEIQVAKTVGGAPTTTDQFQVVGFACWYDP